jgi:hypothetical protein
MCLFNKIFLKSRTPVVLHFIEEVRQGTTCKSYSSLLFLNIISYLYIYTYIYIYLKYFIRVRLFTHLWTLLRKNKAKRKRERGVLELSYSYEIFERKGFYVKGITTQTEVRLSSRTPVVLVVLHSFFEKPFWGLICN